MLKIDLGNNMRPTFAPYLLVLLPFWPTQVFTEHIASVMTFGAVCDGAKDDTLAIRAAAAAVPDSGGILLFPEGICSVSDFTPLKSKTHVLGKKVTIRNMPSSAWPHGVEGAFRLDGVAHITIEGLHFAWQHGFYNGGAAHIIQGVESRDIVIRNNVSEGGGDFAAFIGSADVLVQKNRVTEVDNACYDFWGGSHRIRVIDNTCATTAREHPGVGGIQFTGINTDGTPAINSGFYASGNTVEINTPNGQAFEINGSESGGKNDNIKIIDNKIIVAAHAWGVLVTHASHGEIARNTIEATRTSIFGAVYVSDTCLSWIVADNKAFNVPVGINAVYTNKSELGLTINNSSEP